MRFQEPSVLGWFDPMESFMLMRLSFLLPPESVVVEVGSFCGKSSRYLAVGCSFSESHLFCVDTFASSPDGLPENDDPNPYAAGNILKNCAAQGGTLPVFHQSLMFSIPPDLKEKVIPIIGDSIETAASWNRSKIDLIFIDGDHSKCADDVEAWHPHLASHAMICLHDCAPQCNVYGPKGAVQTRMELMQKGWKQYDFANITCALTRDPGWWDTRKESFHDHGFLSSTARG